MRIATACIIQDPATKRRHPRGYIESLEQHIAFLERHLRDVQPGVDIDRLTSSTEILANYRGDETMADMSPPAERVESRFVASKLAH